MQYSYGTLSDNGSIGTADSSLTSDYVILSHTYASLMLIDERRFPDDLEVTKYHLCRVRDGHWLLDPFVFRDDICSLETYGSTFTIPSSGGDSNHRGEESAASSTTAQRFVQSELKPDQFVSYNAMNCFLTLQWSIADRSVTVRIVVWVVCTTTPPTTTISIWVLFSISVRFETADFTEPGPITTIPTATRGRS